MKLEFNFKYRHPHRLVNPFILSASGYWTNETHFVRGPSGAGKSTLLRLFAGLISPQNGYLRLNERTLFDSENKIDIPATLRKVGMVFQDNLLFPHMSVEQNILYGNSDIKFASVLMEALDIGTIRSKNATKISGGEQRRVAIARALAPRPELLLLDEPFTGLNHELRKALSELLKTISIEYKVGVVVISHDYLELFDAVDNLSVHGMDCGILTDH